MGSKEGSVKETSLPQVAAKYEGTEKVPLAGDLLETGHEVKDKYKEQGNKDSPNAHEMLRPATWPR